VFFRTVDFSRYSAIKIGQPENVLVLEAQDTFPRDRYLIGGANNLLISPSPPPLMMLGKDFDYIRIEKDYIEAGAATKTGRLVSFAKKNDLGGFEFCAKLPGTVGAMVAMNAGVKSYETFDMLTEVCIENDWLRAEEIPHGYRFADLCGVVTAVRFRLERGFQSKLLEELNALRANQPKEPSAGSFFKNPPGAYAGKLIEEVGLKGVRKGDIAWSEHHANFLVNLGRGTFDDALFLVEEAKKRVFDAFGIELVEEVKIL
jgi:UDP-N-acetylmuramate dehydrogenase